MKLTEYDIKLMLGKKLGIDPNKRKVDWFDVLQVLKEMENKS